MSNKQNKDNVNQKEIASIGFIRGSFHTERNTALEEKYRKWVDECATAIKPCSHTIEETEQYFLQRCEAVPMDRDDNRLKSYQYSVVMNYNLKNRLSEISQDMNDETFDTWSKEQSDIRREIMNSMPEHYGIKTTGYYLPQTERNLYLYKEFKDIIKSITKQKDDISMQTFCRDTCFFFEKTTEDIQCNNGGLNLINKLFVYRGVREEDIKLKNARFQGYLTSMRDLGNL